MATLSSQQETERYMERVPDVGAPRGRSMLERLKLGDPQKLARGLGWFSIGLGAAELLAPRAISRLVGARNSRRLVRAWGAREMAAGIGILTATRPAPWLWARVAGDALDLTSLGGTLASPKAERGRTIFGIASVAGVTALDVMCAREVRGAQWRRGARAEASMIVNRSPEECYRFWRNFENLPRFMSYLQSVAVSGERTSHWIARLPGGRRIGWDAVIVTDLPNRRISWRSLPGSELSNSGSVEFESARGDRGTIVRVQIDYGNRLHAAASAAAALVGKHPEDLIRKDLHRFKQAVETGEVITTEGQPAGRRSSVTWLDRIAT